MPARGRLGGVLWGGASPRGFVGVPGAKGGGKKVCRGAGPRGRGCVVSGCLAEVCRGAVPKRGWPCLRLATCVAHRLKQLPQLRGQF